MNWLILDFVIPLPLPDNLQTIAFCCFVDDTRAYLFVQKRTRTKCDFEDCIFSFYTCDFVENPMHRKKMMYPVYINIKFMKVIGDESVTFCHKCDSIFHKIMFIVCTVG